MPPLRLRSPFVGVAVLLASVGAITAVNFGLREVVPVVSTGVVYLLAVLLVSSWWGLWMGLATAIASALTWNWFHIPPTNRFTIADERLVRGLPGWTCGSSPTAPTTGRR